MACGTFTVAKVPADQLAVTENLFKANKPPPISVSHKLDGDGTYTVVAEFPPCPENTTHTA